MSNAKKAPKPNMEQLQTDLQALIAQGRKEGMIRAADLNAHLEKLDLTPEKIEEIYQKLMRQPWIGEHRVVKDVSDYEGYSFLKVYDAGCSRKAMLHELEKIMGTERTITFGGENGRYDVYSENADRNLLVKELKRRCEPMDFHCWKSVFQR